MEIRRWKVEMKEEAQNKESILLEAGIKRKALN
jgi:hypothetical protein